MAKKKKDLDTSAFSWCAKEEVPVQPPKSKFERYMENYSEDQDPLYSPTLYQSLTIFFGFMGMLDLLTYLLWRGY